MIVCGSPTCAARVYLIGGRRATPAVLARVLRELGWRHRQEPGDDRPRWFCGRCAD